MTQSIDREFLILLHEVAHFCRTRVDQVARTRGMTRAQWVTLAKLERQPGLTQNDLASLLEVEPITAARLVDRLEAQGYVERRPDPKDRRVWRLHLLPASQPLLKEITRYRAEFQREITQGIDPKTLEIIREGLLQMKANLTDGRARTAV